MYLKNNKPLAKHTKPELLEVCEQMKFNVRGIYYIYKLKKKSIIKVIELLNDLDNDLTISNTPITKTFNDDTSVTYTLKGLKDPIDCINKLKDKQYRLDLYTTNKSQSVLNIKGITDLLNKLYNDLYDDSIATGQYADIINRQNAEYRANLRRNKTVNEIKALGDEATIFKYYFLK